MMQLNSTVSAILIKECFESEMRYGNNVDNVEQLKMNQL